MNNQTLGIYALVFALALVAIAPTVASFGAFANNKGNDNNKGNNNNKGNDNNNNDYIIDSKVTELSKKDSPSDDDQGKGNDPNFKPGNNNFIWNIPSAYADNPGDNDQGYGNDPGNSGDAHKKNDKRD